MVQPKYHDRKREETPGFSYCQTDHQSSFPVKCELDIFGMTIDLTATYLLFVRKLVINLM